VGARRIAKYLTGHWRENHLFNLASATGEHAQVIGAENEPLRRAIRDA
jgi:hypothetical protein